MAGMGPAPKDPAQRRRRNAPARGEWVHLKPLAKPVLPTLPKRGQYEGPWSARTRDAWAAWRQDPVTGTYSSADIAAAVELAWLFEAAVHGKEKTSEVRLRMDGLGLTPKGKRDLRLRLLSENDEPAEVIPLKTAALRRLRAVDPGGA
jgi:hypothetical protein